MDQYSKMIAEIPMGLDRAVLRALEAHQGKDQALGRKELVGMVAKLGFACHDRHVRETIKQMRRKGYLICSAAGEDGGYYLARNMAEYQAFKETEYLAKIVDMHETLAAMDAAARQAFGDGVQLSLL